MLNFKWLSKNILFYPGFKFKPNSPSLIIKLLSYSIAIKSMSLILSKLFGIESYLETGLQIEYEKFFLPN